MNISMAGSRSGVSDRASEISLHNHPPVASYLAVRNPFRFEEINLIV
jgi:hypothetical protein